MKRKSSGSGGDVLISAVPLPIAHPHHLREVSQEVIFDVKSQDRSIKVLQKLTKLYSKQMKSLKYDAFNPKMALDPPFRVLRVFFSVM